MRASSRSGLRSDDAEPVARLTNLSVDVVINTRDRQATAAGASGAAAK
jgi:hypothetical protein